MTKANTPKEEVERWLNGEGYPLEFQVARSMREALAGDDLSPAGFASISRGEYVSDPLTEKKREIDVLAELISATTRHLYRVAMLVECKTIHRPWVFFVDDQMQQARLQSWRDIPCSSPFGRAAVWLMDQRRELFSSPVVGVDEPIAYGVADYAGKQSQERGKRANGDGGKEVSYATFQSIASAAYAYVHLFEHPSADPAPVGVAVPVVVVKGEMFTARYCEDRAALVAEPADHVMLGWNGSPAAPGRCLIHAIRADHLPAFAEERVRPLRQFSALFAGSLSRVENALETRVRDSLGIPMHMIPADMPDMLETALFGLGAPEP